VRLRALAHIRGGAERGIEILSRRLVLDQLQGADQALAAGLADQLLLAQFPEPPLEARRDLRDMSENIAFLVDLESFERHGGGDRMAS